MDRNKLLYFIVGATLIVFGYVTRVMQVENYYRSSTILITMGLFFIFALMFKKANAGVLILIDLLVCGGLHLVRLTNIPWYNILYDSKIGEVILGGPFHYMVLVYVLCGTFLGLLFEMIMRQYNKIGFVD